MLGDTIHQVLDCIHKTIFYFTQKHIRSDDVIHTSATSVCVAVPSWLSDFMFFRMSVIASWWCWSCEWLDNVLAMLIVSSAMKYTYVRLHPIGKDNAFSKSSVLLHKYILYILPYLTFGANTTRSRVRFGKEMDAFGRWSLWFHFVGCP